jgi:hypothetical protein
VRRENDFRKHTTASTTRVSRPALKRLATGKKAPAKPLKLGNSIKSSYARRNSCVAHFGLVALREERKNPFGCGRSRTTAKAGYAEAFEFEEPSS